MNPASHNRSSDVEVEVVQPCEGPSMKSARNRVRDDPSTLTCSTGGRMFLLDETENPPFCSERCKLIDLGRWMDEEIGLPHEGGPPHAEGFEPEQQEQEEV